MGDNMNEHENMFVKYVSKFENILGTKILGFVSCLLFSVMIGAMVFQVFCRFILKMSVPWSEEIIRYLFIVGTYLTASLATVEKKHVEIDILDSIVRKVNPKYRLVLAKADDILRVIISLSFSVVISVLCYKFMVQSKKIGQFTPALGMPRYWLDVAIFLGWTLMVLFNVTLLIKSILMRNGSEEGAK
jgi:TRAP-type C4-dicarboxylate transport system permease small subunit